MGQTFIQDTHVLKANGFVLHWIESSKSTIAIRRVTNLKQSKPCHKWEGFYTSENTVHTYTSCIYHVCLMYPLNFTLHHPWYTIIHVFTTTRGNTLDIQTPPNNWNIPRKLRRENLSQNTVARWHLPAFGCIEEKPTCIIWIYLMLISSQETWHWYHATPPVVSGTSNTFNSSTSFFSKSSSCLLSCKSGPNGQSLERLHLSLR